jgi:regulator of protease activity HflC (stomatin/prohibitin superfamily)
MWRQFGEEKIRRLALSSIIEDFKKTIGQYTIFEIAVNQEKIRQVLADKFISNMTKYPVIVNEVKITNYDWSAEFDNQIQTTMARAQQVKQKEQELLITEQEAQKMVKQAEATKQAAITEAEEKKKQQD